MKKGVLWDRADCRRKNAEDTDHELGIFLKLAIAADTSEIFSNFLAGFSVGASGSLLTGKG
jgi:hypothetical protein